jgi:hypothetical protein
MSNPAPTTEVWEVWAPPLDPPTEGGVPRQLAYDLADKFWPERPWLFGLLLWQFYAAMLDPSPSVSHVSTGSQSASYSPAQPGGDFGRALARIAFFERMLGDLHSIPLAVEDPQLVDPTIIWDP